MTEANLAFAQALAEVGVAVASASADEVAEDTAVRALELAAAGIRPADPELHGRLMALLERRARDQPASGSAIAEFVSALDLAFTSSHTDPAWLGAPSRPALISRKVAVVPSSLGLRQAASHEAAAAQNHQFVRWEVPTALEAARAERVFQLAGTSRIEVRIIAEARSLAGSDALASAVVDEMLLLETAADDDIDPDLAVELTEAMLFWLGSVDEAGRREIVAAIESAASGLEPDSRQIVSQFVDAIAVDD